jgi:hypothetical protein
MVLVSVLGYGSSFRKGSLTTDLGLFARACCLGEVHLLQNTIIYTRPFQTVFHAYFNA